MGIFPVPTRYLTPKTIGIQVNPIEVDKPVSLDMGIFVYLRIHNIHLRIIFCKTKYLEGSQVNNGGKIMCKAAEVGKIVVNKCLSANLSINTQKLQKLLVLMQVECIKRSGKPLFKEDVRIWKCGVAIKEVDEEFRNYGEGFDSHQEEFITLLEAEEKSVDCILERYGQKDAFELNLLPENQKVIRLGVKIEGATVPHVSYQILMGAFL